MRINNTNSKNRLWVNIYLLGIFWKNYQFFDLLWSIFGHNWISGNEIFEIMWLRLCQFHCLE